jgi:hypothetical protein
MQRTLWTSSISQHWCPSWACPSCETGRLILRHNSVTFQETVDSRREHGEDYWGPEYIELIFTAWADCNNAQCKETIAMSGTGGVEQFFNESNEEYDWQETFTPKNIRPAPKIIDLPSSCPKPISNLFDAAFSLYWTDAEASAGKIRSALEELLTHLGVPDTDNTDPAKPKRLSLHKRIELLQKSHPEQSRLLMAIKWMGNSGSHGGTVSRSDVLDALEILEHTLPELLEKKSDHVKALAERLLKKHQP